MFMKYIGVWAAATLCVVLGMLFSNPVAATGESYGWTDYSTIGGRSGAYMEAIGNSEGSDYVLSFKQSEDNPAIFSANPGVDECNGTITLTLSSTVNNSGTLTVSGDCPLLSRLSRDVTVDQSRLITSKVDYDSLIMRTSFQSNSCNEVAGDTAVHKECTDQAATAYEQHTSSCKGQFDYTKRPYLANQYLDCLAEALGVERPSASQAEKKEPKSTSKCSIPDVGWIMCQALQFMGWIADQSFNLLSSMLEVEPVKEQINGQDSKLHAAWKVSLGFANVVFVFAFIFMILSYVTSWGIGVYGLKSLAPRMLIAVLLVNLSFFLCGIAVDLSNILGGTLKNTLVELTPPASGTPNYSTWSELTETVVSITPNDESYTKDNVPGASRESEGAQQSETPPAANQPSGAEGAADDADLWPTQTTVLLAGATLVGGAVLFANLSVLVPFMAAALVAIITVLIVLIIRQAVIICLIAISPVAIALYVLPNTKSWFNKWLDIFTKFLMIYPAVALVFGASYFASRVILDQATENGQTFLAMFALGIQVIPLFITPVIMKLGAGVLDRFAGVVNNKNKGPLDAIKRKAGEFREDRKNQQVGRAASGATSSLKDPSSYGNFIKNPNAARLRRNMRKNAGDEAVNSALERAKATAFSNQDSIQAATKGLKPGEFLDELTEELLADAAKELHDIDVSRISATVARFAQDKNLDANAYQDMAETGSRNGQALSDIERAAAIQLAANTAASDKAHDLILASGTMNDALRRVLVDSLRKSGFTKQNAHFGGSAMNAVAEGRITTQADVNTLVERAAEGGKYSADAIAGQSSHALGMLNTAIDEGRVSQAASNIVIENAHTALSTPALNSRINTNSRAGVERLAK